MKNYPSSFSILIIFVLLTMVGMALLPRLNFCLQPFAGMQSLSIGVSWRNASPRVLEQEVTSKLEALVSRVRGIKEINSRSQQGYASIFLVLDKNTDPDAVRLELSGLVRQAYPSFPKGVSYPTIEQSIPESDQQRPLLSYTLNAPKQVHEIYDYYEKELKPVIQRTPGISKCELNGVMPMEWVITCNQKEMDALGIGVNHIQQAIGNCINRENLGFCKTANSNNKSTTIQLIIAGNMTDSIDFNRILIPTNQGRMVYLHNIATIEHRMQKPWEIYRINGLNSLVLDIYPTPGANNMAVAKQTKKILQTLEPHFPKGYNLLLVNNSSEYIRKELDNIYLRTFAALFILLLFIFIVTRRWKHLLMILFTLVANISIAAIFYYLFHIEIHLYALAGITVSLGLMTDNIIIMSEHIRSRGNIKAWLAIFAGTLATAASLIVIFFMDERVRLNLTDFAAVIIINQTVSLITALFLVPALMSKLQLEKRKKNIETKKIIRSPFPPSLKLLPFFFKYRTHRPIRLFHIYQRTLNMFHRFKFISITLLIFAFGLPVFLLPAKWEGERWFHAIYNTTIGSNTYNENIRPITDIALGGALRLFVNNVYEGSYFKEEQETVLFIHAQMPNGTTIAQIDKVMAGMELHLRRYPEIRMFRTSVYNRFASIEVYFTKSAEKGGFPYQLKNEAISKAIELGSADWRIYGVGNDGFNNDANENAGSYVIEMLGYNYDQLYQYAELLRDSLNRNARVKEVYILPEQTWKKPDNMGFSMSIDNEKLKLSGIDNRFVYGALQRAALTGLYAGQTQYKGKNEDIKIETAESLASDSWMLEHNMQQTNSTSFKFNNVGVIKQERLEQSICKKNQQFVLNLQFDYIGIDEFARSYINKAVVNFKPSLPVGYSVIFEKNRRWWGDKSIPPYWLILLIAGMIFFICAILFESLLQPFAVILTIPISYIGVFLTFYIFDLKFDQGGFAAFIMLTGLTVSAAIYILNDFDCLNRDWKKKLDINHSNDLGEFSKVKKIEKKMLQRFYFKAFHFKIIPILLTMLSTMLGFVPFLIGEKQPFWFSLAAGVIGGLLFSLIGIVLYLPLFLGVLRKKQYYNP
jgi:multidrug efflux pump subunit AcrB